MSSRASIYLFCLFFVVFAFEEARGIDTVDTKVREELDSLYLVSWDLLYTNPDSSLSISRKYFHKSRKYQSSNDVAYALDLIGLGYYYKNELQTAVTYHKKANKMFAEQKDSIGLSSTFLNLGNAYSYLGYFLRAIDNYQKSLAIDRAAGYLEGEAYSSLNISGIFLMQENYTEAEKYIRKAIEIDEKYNDSYLKSSTHNSLAELLIHKGKLDEAEEYAREALEEAKKYTDLLQVASALSNLSLIDSKRGNHREALKKGKEALKRAKEYGDPYSVALYYKYLAQVHIAAGNKEEALATAKKAYELSGEEHSNILSRGAAQTLSEAYELNNDPGNALRYFKEYKSRNDSIIELNIQEKLLKSQNEIQQEKNRLLEARNTMQNEIITRNTVLIAVISLLLLLCIAFIFSLIINIKKRQSFNHQLIKKNELIEEKQVEIDAQRELLLKQNQELQGMNQTKDKLFSILTHDLKQPFNQIVGIIELMEFGQISEEDKKDLLHRLKDSAVHTRSSVENLLIWSKTQFAGMSVNPKQVKIGELIESLKKQLRDTMESKNITVRKNIPDSLTAFADFNHTEIILRNLLINALKFSVPGNFIDVDAGFAGEEIFIEVRDYGLGMSKEQVDRLGDFSDNLSTPGTLDEKGTGLGILIVHEFLEANHGQLIISSEKGKGSIFRIVLPQKEKE